MEDLPRLIRPMMATLIRELPGDQERYGWELKWDGVRAVAYVRGASLRLLSRSDKEMSASYPELHVLGSFVAEPVVLDGEIVTLRDGRPDFGTGILSGASGGRPIAFPPAPGSLASRHGVHCGGRRCELHREQGPHDFAHVTSCRIAPSVAERADDVQPAACLGE